MTLRASVPVQDTAVLHSSNIRTLKQWIALCFKGSSLSSGTKVLEELNGALLCVLGFCPQYCHYDRALQHSFLKLSAKYSRIGWLKCYCLCSTAVILDCIAMHRGGLGQDHLHIVKQSALPTTHQSHSNMLRCYCASTSTTALSWQKKEKWKYLQNFITTHKCVIMLASTIQQNWASPLTVLNLSWVLTVAFST